MFKRISIFLLAITALAGPALAQSDDPSSADYEPPTMEIESRDAAGHYQLACFFDYFAVNYETALEESHPKMGWTWFSSGEPLLFQYNGPLSDDRVDPLNPGSCPEGTDPAAEAAILSSECILRLPGTRYRFCAPCYPFGRFYRAELPDGGAAFIRTALDAPDLHKPVAKLNGEEYPFLETDALSVLLELQQGERDWYRGAGWSIEEMLAEAEALAYIAFRQDSKRPMALLDAQEVLLHMLYRFYERHSRYPESIAELATVPGAICAALPHSPWDFERELGLATLETVGNGDILYLPEHDADGLITGGRLFVISDAAWEGYAGVELPGLSPGLYAYNELLFP